MRYLPGIGAFLLLLAPAAAACQVVVEGRSAACPAFRDAPGDVGLNPANGNDDIDLLGVDFDAGRRAFTVGLKVAGMSGTSFSGDRAYRLTFRLDGARYVALEGLVGLQGETEFRVLAGSTPDLLAPAGEAIGRLDAARSRLSISARPATLGLVSGARLDQFVARTTAGLRTGASLAEDTASWPGIVTVGGGCSTAG